MGPEAPPHCNNNNNYTSTTFTSAEHNYTTTDQECLGVIHALQDWRCYLEGSEFTLLTDHHPLV